MVISHDAGIQDWTRVRQNIDYKAAVLSTMLLLLTRSEEDIPQTHGYYLFTGPPNNLQVWSKLKILPLYLTHGLKWKILNII